MKYIQLFLLTFQDALTDKSRQVVWFLIAWINPLVLLLFWRGAVSTKGEIIPGWDITSITTYYFLFIIVNALLHVHIEEDIAYNDIQQGNLVRFLVRPLAYWWFKLFAEIPSRIIQGGLGIAVMVLCAILFDIQFDIATSGITFVLGTCIILLAFGISFVFKMLVGLSALWTTDFSGLSQLIGVIILIFGGFLEPLEFYPENLRAVSYILPFSHIFYFPVLFFQNKLSITESIWIVVRQAIWLFVLAGMYKVIWSKGVRRFTGVGQ